MKPRFASGGRLDGPGDPQGQIVRLGDCMCSFRMPERAQLLADINEGYAAEEED